MLARWLALKKPSDGNIIPVPWNRIRISVKHNRIIQHIWEVDVQYIGHGTGTVLGYFSAIRNPERFRSFIIPRRHLSDLDERVPSNSVTRMWVRIASY